MGVTLPKVTSDRVCCPSCGQRAPYLPNGLTDWHTNRAGGLCAGVFPPYVTARDPQAKRRRPVLRPASAHGWRAPRAFRP